MHRKEQHRLSSRTSCAIGCGHTNGLACNSSLIASLASKSAITTTTTVHHNYCAREYLIGDALSAKCNSLLPSTVYANVVAQTLILLVLCCRIHSFIHAGQKEFGGEGCILADDMWLGKTLNPWCPYWSGWSWSTALSGKTATKYIWRSTRAAPRGGVPRGGVRAFLF